MLAVTMTWRSGNPGTIAAALSRQLGREPTHAELKAEVARILREAKEA